MSRAPRFAIDVPVIEIVEVGPRDGLQNEPQVLPVAQKIELVRRLIAAGVRRVEVASFVSPTRVPQMADAEAVVAGLPHHDQVSYIGLALNVRGAERAIAAGLPEIGAVVSATDTFGLRNQNQTTAQSLAEVTAIARRAAAAGRRVQATISVAFGCPYEGRVSPEHVVDLARHLADLGLTGLGLADTIGVAVPADVADLFDRIRAAVAPLPVRAHFHDTRRTGIANVWAAVQAGASQVDASIAGLGGCPFAPGATGNVATEDVVYLLHRSGIQTGIDLAGLVSTGRWIAGVLGRDVESGVGRAGP